MNVSVCVSACLSVCLSVWKHISKTTHLIFTKFSMVVASDRVVIPYVRYFRFCE